MKCTHKDWVRFIYGSELDLIADNWRELWVILQIKLDSICLIEIICEWILAAFHQMSD